MVVAIEDDGDREERFSDLCLDLTLLIGLLTAASAVAATKLRS